MHIDRLLIANRGEIAVRIARTAAEMGIETVAVHSTDDASSPHLDAADQAVALPASGPKAYLDHERLAEIAAETGCAALHPGYGFASESPLLAAACERRGVVFVGPKSDTLAQLADKTTARAIAGDAGIEVLRGTPPLSDASDARRFAESLPAGASVMLKAAAGGGGRGMRVVGPGDAIEAAFEVCAREAEGFFGDGRVFCEEYAPRARHIEIQLIGDSGGAVMQLGERDCSIQRRHQKIIEIAPAPQFDGPTLETLKASAVNLGSQLGLVGVATAEFLVWTDDAGGIRHAFIEANPRLQVEHTITEEVTGLDLVRLQLRVASGESLADCGLARATPPVPNGYAIQLRVNTERLGDDGEWLPTGGLIEALELPSGPGVRVDTYARAGYRTSPAFDSLLAKTIVHTTSPNFGAAVAKAQRALRELSVGGVPINAGALAAIMELPEFAAAEFDTQLVERSSESIASRAAALSNAAGPGPAPTALAGASLDADDPLAILDHGKREDAGSSKPGPASDEPGAVCASMQGTIVSIEVEAGQEIAAGAPLLVMEAMKMEHLVPSPVSGRVGRFEVSPGDAVYEGALLAVVEAGTIESAHASDDEAVDLDAIRGDLAESIARHELGLDDARPKAVARRRKTGQRTARENIEDLVDAGSFREYGPLVIAAQRRRREIQDLIENTPGDGMVCGTATVNGDDFGAHDARCVVMTYDYTVLAGTQGLQNHRKKDRMFELAERMRLPVVLFSEGGGGRPGDTDSWGGSGLDTLAFQYFAQLSGLVPLVGINSGRCFAGNAALLGCCDVVIATRDSNIGMGGPAMVEGGGLGAFRPEEIGPIDVQTRNGVVDIEVADEAEAVATAKRYLSYFQGDLDAWEAHDQRSLRTLVPENRLRVYDVRRVIEALADKDSVLELRRDFGVGMITSLARIEGRAIGIVANNPMHLAGAIDSENADKGARFMQLCDAFDIPILFLCDTPGIMVGPEAEKTALVRHAARMFVVGSNVSVPFFSIMLRKSYGLGAMAMAGGGFKAGLFSVAWPTGEFGGMGLEGAVKLAFRKELAAIDDAAERKAAYEQMVAKMYEMGKAVNTASHFEIDDVIDPADSRSWVVSALDGVPRHARRRDKKRPCIDSW